MYTLREAIPVMRLLWEIKKHNFPIQHKKAPVHLKLFKDNSGTVKMAQVAKYWPRIKHLNLKLHHFRSYIDKNHISITKISTEDQQAEILTKPLWKPSFALLIKNILGW